LVAAAAVAAVVLASGSDPPGTVAPLTYNAVAAVDPGDGTIRAAVSLPDLARIAVGEGAVWVGSDASGAISAIDPRTHRVERSFDTDAFPSELAAGAGSVWVADGPEGELLRIDPTYGQIEHRLRFRRRGEAPADRFELDALDLAVGAGGVWVADGSSRLLRADPATGETAAEIPAGHPLLGVAVGAGAVWAISGPDATLLRVDPTTNRVAGEIEIVDAPAVESPFPLGVAVAGGYVWVLSANTAGVTKVDPRTRGIVNTTRIGIDRLPTRIAGGRDALWVANDDGTLVRIDAVTDEVATYRVGRSLQDVAVGGGAVWATNQLTDCCGNE
jgi:streptogramin lyase